MIPLSLRLHNFMSYGEDTPPLDFSRFTTACLTGDNGHGKSTLLDAITWALWGETRAKSLDDVVRLGQDEAEVEFIFDLENERYRVLRKRSLKTRQSALELQGFDQATQRYRPLSGASIRETEAKIVQLLHMNYDTFINSVFVLQGRADEFTTRRPGERKRILADILGLSIYDTLEARAQSAPQRDGPGGQNAASASRRAAARGGAEGRAGRCCQRPPRRPGAPASGAAELPAIP